LVKHYITANIAYVILPLVRKWRNAFSKACMVSLGMTVNKMPIKNAAPACCRAFYKSNRLAVYRHRV